MGEREVAIDVLASVGTGSDNYSARVRAAEELVQLGEGEIAIDVFASVFRESDNHSAGVRARENLVQLGAREPEIDPGQRVFVAEELGIWGDWDLAIEDMENVIGGGQQMDPLARRQAKRWPTRE